MVEKHLMKKKTKNKNNNNGREWKVKCHKFPLFSSSNSLSSNFTINRWFYWRKWENTTNFSNVQHFWRQRQNMFVFGSNASGEIFLKILGFSKLFIKCRRYKNGNKPATLRRSWDSGLYDFILITIIEWRC